MLIIGQILSSGIINTQTLKKIINHRWININY